MGDPKEEMESVKGGKQRLPLEGGHKGDWMGQRVTKCGVGRYWIGVSQTTKD